MSVELKEGMRITALRMSNKAIKLTGTLAKINDDGKTVEMTVDGTENGLETVHVNDVKPLGEEKSDVQGKSLTTVNGKPI
jgi:hypothetical protein